jgi:molybdenum cofactor cytidylyltransferase
LRRVTAPVGILLAAGRGRRFGSHKLLHPLPDGTPLGLASARAMRTALDRVVAVVRPRDEALAAVLREVGCEILPCARADEGMGTSLACGVAATPEAAGWLIALADMPFIRAETIAAVAAALRAGASIAAPVLADGRRGHPVGFAAEWLDELRALDGDAGARRLLQEHGARVRWLRTDDPGCTVDIDLPGDVAAA